MKVYKFDVMREERKALVKTISEIMGLKAVYKGAPGFEYVVGDYKINPAGSLVAFEYHDEVELNYVVTKLVDRGYVYEGYEPVVTEVVNLAESTEEVDAVDLVEAIEEDKVVDLIEDTEEIDATDLIETTETTEEDVTVDEEADNEHVESADSLDLLSIEIPVENMTQAALVNLEKLVASKAWILKKMVGTDSLPIERRDDRISFPWFKVDSSASEVEAYTKLIVRLCATAREKKRISAQEKLPSPGENEKYKARCMLLALDFIGDDYKEARKILLANMPGNGSFLQGDQKKKLQPPPEPEINLNVNATA